MNERLLDEAEVAKRLSCTTRHLQNLRKRDPADAPPSFLVGRLRRYPESGVNAWIASRLTQQAA